MPFNYYKSVGVVVKEFQINYRESAYIVETEIDINEYFKDDLAIVIREGIVDNSEYAICENMIYPILKEVWKSYKDKFVLWSHQPLIYDEKLSGIPDYILAKRSPLGKVVFDQPYFVVVEAKKDNFQEEWGQCLAEMIAIQKLNHNPEQTIFGIVSNGEIWEFGKLRLDIFTKNITFYTIQNLEQLFSSVNYIFKQCELQLADL